MCVKEKNNTNNLKPINISCGYQKKGNSWLVKVIFCYLKFKKISCGLVANSVIFFNYEGHKIWQKKPFIQCYRFFVGTNLRILWIGGKNSFWGDNYYLLLEKMN